MSLDDVTYIGDIWPELDPDYKPEFEQRDPGDENDFDLGPGGVTSPLSPRPPQKPGGAAAKIEEFVTTPELELVGCES